MAAYVVQTTDDSNAPRLDVFESLVSSKPMARFGWSYWDELDLRKLAAARANGSWSKSKGKKKHWDRAWPGHAFNDKVGINDLLFYRNLPAKGRFTLVQVTGDYDYLSGGKAHDFRSYRPCKMIAEDVRVSDSRVGGALRRYLNLQGRIYKIPGALALAFVQRLRRKKAKNAKTGGAKSAQKGADLEKYKKRFSYAIGAHEVTVNKEHQAYQLRLKAFLKKRGVTPALEEDHIDVSFESAGERFIGEVKVTNWLSIEEAFRIAIGQVLDYGRAHTEDKPNLLVLFDSILDSRHIALASELRIGVVVETSLGDFQLLNPTVFPDLKEVF